MAVGGRNHFTRKARISGGLGYRSFSQSQSIEHGYYWITIEWQPRVARRDGSVSTLTHELIGFV